MTRSDAASRGQHQKKDTSNQQGSADDWRYGHTLALLGFHLQRPRVEDGVTIRPEHAAYHEHENAGDRQQKPDDLSSTHEWPRVLRCKVWTLQRWVMRL